MCLTKGVIIPYMSSIDKADFSKNQGFLGFSLVLENFHCIEK